MHVQIGKKKGSKGMRGIAQIPLMIALLIMAIAVPIATKLMERSTENRGLATGSCTEACPNASQPNLLQSCHPVDADGTSTDSLCNTVGRVETCGPNFTQYCCPAVGGAWTTDMTKCGGSALSPTPTVPAGCVEHCPNLTQPNLLQSCTPPDTDGTSNDSLCNSTDVNRVENCGNKDYKCDGTKWVALTIPNCSGLNVPATLTVGQAANLSANVYSPQGSLKGEIFYSKVVNGVGQTDINSIKMQTFSGNTGTVTASWTPTVAGSFIIRCRAWNDAVAECRPPAVVDGAPRFPCAGPNFEKSVTVTNVDTHGCGSNEIWNPCTNACVPAGTTIPSVCPTVTTDPHGCASNEIWNPCINACVAAGTTIPSVCPSLTPASSCTQCANDPTAKAKGDANCDGKTDLDDRSILTQELVTENGDTTVKNSWKADFNCDGKVNGDDLTIWTQHYKSSYGVN